MCHSCILLCFFLSLCLMKRIKLNHVIALRSPSFYIPSHWIFPMLRRHSAPMMALRGATVENATRLISPLTFRRPYVTTAQSSRPSTSESTTLSPSKSEQPSEGIDVRTTSQNFATFYLDMIRIRLKKHANLLSSTANLSLAEIGGRLNKVTGYEHIEKLKHKVVETGALSLIQTR